MKGILCVLNRKLTAECIPWIFTKNCSKLDLFAQVTRQAALTAMKEAPNSKCQQANAALAAHNASQTVCRTWQAAELAGEAFANKAASHARNARTEAALTNALRAAQAYEVHSFAHSNNSSC